MMLEVIQLSGKKKKKKKKKREKKIFYGYTGMTNICTVEPIITKSDSELGQVLANLVESCIFESSFGTRDWEKDLGVKMNHFTELLITDSRCLRISQQEPEEATHIERLQRILHYYLDRSYPTSLTRNGY
jgi:hypothetical protein